MRSENFFVVLAPMSLPNHEDEVRRYYDRNTAKFLKVSRAFQPKAIHQPLYEHPKMRLEEALHTHHRKVLGFLPVEHPDIHVLDLGCGVGESLFYLAAHTPAHVSFSGITLSGAQAMAAQHRAQALGLDQRVRIWQGSFQDLPDDLPKADVAFAIEAFIHSPDPEVFFTQVSEQLRPGGLLLLFDDFLVLPIPDPKSQRVYEDLALGYHAHALLTPSHLETTAAAVGLHRTVSEDLTQLLRLFRWQDRMIRAAAPFARFFAKHSEYCRFILGGDARQRAYQMHQLTYRMMGFRK